MGTNRSELAQQAHPARAHVVELHRDAALGRDAGDRALAVLLMDHLAAQPQAPVDAADHRQHGHQTAHPRTLCVGEVLLQEGLNPEPGRERVEKAKLVFVLGKHSQKYKAF